jgi:hypothetical protein
VFQAHQFYYRSLLGEYLDEIRVGTTAQDVAAVVVVPPTPTIARSGNSVIVSWPKTATFTLQQNSNLAVPTSWTKSGYSITTANGMDSITITPLTGNLFFRLSYP